MDEEDIISQLLKLKGPNVDIGDMGGFDLDFSKMLGNGAPIADMSKFTSGFGKGLEGISGSGMGAAVGQGVGMASDIISPKKVNQKFMDQNSDVAAALKKEMGINEVRANVMNSVAALGPWGMVVSGADAISRTVDRASKDDFGVYKSKFGKVADRILDPVGNVMDVASGTTQQDKIDARTKFFNVQDTNVIAQNKKVGNIVKNTSPNYKAAAYGRQGIKFKSKFGKDVA